MSRKYQGETAHLARVHSETSQSCTWFPTDVPPPPAFAKVIFYVRGDYKPLMRTVIECAKMITAEVKTPIGLSRIHEHIKLEAKYLLKLPQ